MLRRAVGWLTISAAGVLLLSTMLAHAPERTRLLFLFSVVFGGGAGWAMGRLAGELEIRHPRLVLLGAPLLVIAGPANIARLNFAQLEARARQRVQENPEELAGMRLLEGMRDGRSRPQQLQQHRLRLEPGFSDYLAARISALGWYGPPWPEIVWGVELALAGLAGAWGARRGMRSAIEVDDKRAPLGEDERVDP